MRCAMRLSHGGACVIWLLDLTTHPSLPAPLSSCGVLLIHEAVSEAQDALSPVLSLHLQKPQDYRWGRESLWSLALGLCMLACTSIELTNIL